MPNATPLEPAAQMRQLDCLVGAWSCRGEVLETPFSTQHSVERAMNAEMDLDGHWLFMLIDERKTAEHPRPLSGNWQMTFDRRAGHFVSLWTDNLGRWAEQSSPGWEGDRLAFTGPTTVDDRPAVVRDTLIKNGAGGLGFLVDFQIRGAWFRFMTLTCKRARVVRDSRALVDGLE
jgi:hypothetical protein